MWSIYLPLFVRALSTGACPYSGALLELYTSKALEVKTMPILEERMIYRVGKSSLAITLPQNWLKYFGLTAGDTVEVTGNGDLTIRPRKGQENDKAERGPATSSGH